ncbi:MAG: DUF1569 domain-containing protein [Gemmatimonadaceae bacterium]
MKNLFEASSVAEIKDRLQRLGADSPRQWGKMSVAQAVVHCARGMQMATGELRPPRAFVGRLIGRVIKPLALGDDAPMRRNSPTAKELMVGDQPDFDAGRQRLSSLIDRFAAAGPAGCTTHPHAFFGPLRPDEWAVLMYKHIDHHLRQFSA